MKAAYVDTSCLVAVAFREPGFSRVRRRLQSFDVLMAASLLEAELRAAFVRESVETEVEAFLGGITWVRPDRRLSAEMKQALSVGRLRGADLWHMACALYLKTHLGTLQFLTLDKAQAAVASVLFLQR